MIEVGKIVTKAQYRGGGFGDGTPEESIQVTIDARSIDVSLARQSGYLSMTPAQAIELGQLLLKAAEVQPEYAVAAKALSEEETKLRARFKDMVSGIGLDSEVDISDPRGTFTKALG